MVFHVFSWFFPWFPWPFPGHGAFPRPPGYRSLTAPRLASVTEAEPPEAAAADLARAAAATERSSGGGYGVKIMEEIHHKQLQPIGSMYGIYANIWGI